MDNTGYKIIVSGHVQGVGFRYYTARKASHLSITGHAKNLNNGNVEVIIYGTPQQTTQMLAWLNKGPTSARIKKVEVTVITYQSITGFSCH